MNETSLETEFGNLKGNKDCSCANKLGITWINEINTCTTGQCAHGAVVIIIVNQTVERIIIQYVGMVCHFYLGF